MPHCSPQFIATYIRRGTAPWALNYWRAMIVIESLAWLTAAGGICFLAYKLIAGLIVGIGSSATGLASQLGV